VFGIFKDNAGKYGQGDIQRMKRLNYIHLLHGVFQKVAFRSNTFVDTLFLK